MKLQDYLLIKKTLLAKNSLFEDQQFPAERRSLFYSNLNSELEIEWKRPFDIVDKPRMFVDGPSRWDIIQGAIGNCWFVSALASICCYPKLIERIIPDSQTFYKEYCGMFYIRFWQFGQWVTIIVDDRLPVKKYTNDLIFIQSMRKEEFWSSIVEKAFAKFYGCYENLHGGRPSSGLLDLTGGISEWYILRDTPANFHNRLLKFKNSNCILSCGIMGSKHQVAEEKKDGNLLSRHAYSITDVKSIELLNKNKDVVRHDLLRIKNPWGGVEWDGAWSKNSPEWRKIPKKKRLSLGLKVEEDGEFWMSYKDFLRNFTDLYVCAVEPQMLGTKSDPAVKWNSISYLGEWDTDIPSTTNILHYNTIRFSQFQQFKVNLMDVDLYEPGNKCELVVALLQRSQRYHRKLGIPMLPIGYYIFHLAKENQSLPLNEAFFKRHHPIEMSRMSDSQEVTCRFKLNPGAYVIIPVTAPKKRGEFLLRMCYEKRGNIWGHVVLYNQNTGMTHGALDDDGWYTSTVPKIYTSDQPHKLSIESGAPFVTERRYVEARPMPGTIPTRHRDIAKHLVLEDSYDKMRKATPPKLLGTPAVKRFRTSCQGCHINAGHMASKTNEDDMMDDGSGVECCRLGSTDNMFRPDLKVKHPTHRTMPGYCLY